MERVVDISMDGLHLATHRGFLTVSASGEERGRVALDDVCAPIVQAHGTTWSNSVIVRLSLPGKELSSSENAVQRQRHT